MLIEALLGNYKPVAERLGLTIDADARIHGTVDGISLNVWFGPHATHIGALLPRPAPLELGIATKGLIAKLADLFGSHKGEIGDATFDKDFAVKTADPSRVAALLDPDARKTLLEMANEGLHPAVDAHSVHLRRFSQGGLIDSEQRIEGDFRSAVRLAQVIGNSFAGAYR